MLLLAGSGRLMVLDFEPSSADFPPTPAGVPTATCVGCGLTIHQRPDGVWLLEGPPWWCYPDRELIGVLAQNHTPPANPPDVGGGDQVTATLYRWYGRHGDRDDVLLYIGQTGGRQRRPLAHRSKQWWADVRRGTIEHVPAGEVLRLERAAIEAERPVWNVTWNPGPRPEPPGANAMGVIEPAHEDDLNDDG
jgi:hypothetical protein